MRASMRLFAALSLVSLFVCSASAALAAPKISSVSATPSPTFARKPVAITVQGTGRCTFNINFGDNNRLTNITAPFPYQQTHSYALSGTYTVTAKAVAGTTCTGTASAAVVVQFSTTSFSGSQRQSDATKALADKRTKQMTGGAAGELECMFSGCNPQVTDLSFSAITPGGGAIVLGSGFGNQIGPHSAIILSIRSYQNSVVTVPLIDLTWDENAVSGKIPDGISGVVDGSFWGDGSSTLQVITGSGAQSNTINVNFLAARDIEQLIPNDLSVDCSQEGTDNMCTGHPNDIGNQCGFLGHLDPRGFLNSGAAVFASHDSGAWHGNSGNDVYSSRLKFGWVFDSYNCTTSTDDPGDSDNWANAAAATFPQGQSNMQFRVDWSNGACNDIDYDCNVAIAGPVGVPWR